MVSSTTVPFYVFIKNKNVSELTDEEIKNFSYKIEDNENNRINYQSHNIINGKLAINFQVYEPFYTRYFSGLYKNFMNFKNSKINEINFRTTSDITYSEWCFSPVFNLTTVKEISIDFIKNTLKSNGIYTTNFYKNTNQFNSFVVYADNNNNDIYTFAEITNENYYVKYKEIYFQANNGYINQDEIMAVITNNIKLEDIEITKCKSVLEEIKYNPNFDYEKHSNFYDRVFLANV